MVKMMFTYVTVLTNKEYLPGVWALSQALSAVKSKYGFAVLVPEDRGELKEILESWGLDVVTAPTLPAPAVLRSSEHRSNHWNETFFKLRVAELAQYKKIVLLDSDMVILKNLDELFERPSYSAVAADQFSMSFSEQLNSGLMVLEPGEELKHRLQDCLLPAVERCLVAGRAAGDQDVFQEAYPDWPERTELHIPPQYNLLQGVSGEVCRKVISGGYRNVCVVHFIGSKKPWSFHIRDYLYIFYHGLKQRNFAEWKANLRYQRYLKTMPPI